MDFRDIIQYTRQGQWEVDYSIEKLVEQIDKWVNEEDLELCPDFQRGHVWTEEQQVAYIMHILRGGTSGKTIFLNNPNWQEHRSYTYTDFVCVDGLQRITAIKRFINNEIKVFEHYYKDFTGTLRIYHNIKVNINNLKTKKEVLQWYIEMNEGGTPHTKEEIDKVKELISIEEAKNK